MDNRTWRKFFSLMEERWVNFGDLLHPWYREGMNFLYQFRNEVPTLQELNDALRDTGWQVQYVKGYAPIWQIAEMLGRKIMPISAKVRPYDQLLFAKEPDLLHDVFGHLPSLFSSEYRQLLEAWCRLAESIEVNDGDRTTYHLNKMIVAANENEDRQGVKHLSEAAELLKQFIIDRPYSYLFLDKAYFWIMEFGLIKKGHNFQILGAGIVSSLSEWERIGSLEVPHLSLKANLLTADTAITTAQQSFLVAESEDDFFEILENMASHSTTEEIACGAV